MVTWPIAQDEFLRRSRIVDASILLMQPLTKLVEQAQAGGATVSFKLQPPQDRTSVYAWGTLRCRSFHNGVGQRIRRYRIDVDPLHSTCTVYLETGYKMSREEEEENFGNEELVWECTFGVKQQPFIKDLCAMVEEALITEYIATKKINFINL